MSARQYIGVGCGAALVLGAILVTARASFSQSNAARLIGSWEARVTAVNPPNLPPFTSLITFSSDGTVIESRRLLVPATPFGPLLETPAHGGWMRTAANEFDVSFKFLLQNANDGSEVGSDNIRLHVRLNAAGNQLNGTFVSTIQDTAGNPLFSASGNYDAKPIP